MFCQCFPVDVDPEAAADTAIARFAEVCPQFPDRIVDRLALGPQASSRSASASRAATSSTARCCPGSCSRTGPTGARFGGIEGLYLAGSGAHPGGAVSGAPGLLAARAVLEDVAAPRPDGARAS